MIRHEWVKIDEDLRRYPDEARCVIHMCRKCGVYRLSLRLNDKWTTRYGEPYKTTTRDRPECRS